MKSAAEIRAHRDALRVCMQAPCGCRGTVHEAKCLMGLKLMNAVCTTLSWALGEAPAMQSHVDEMGQRAAFEKSWNRTREN